MMRRFGVELELVTPPAGQGNALAFAANILNGMGITAQIAGHLGNNYSIWQCKHDGTIRPAPRGVEVVSRIMPASPDSYDEIMRVATRLDSDGFAVNRTCGLHVHVNVSDLPVRTRLLIVLHYAAHQTEYNLMMPASRRSGNSYCSAMHDSDRASLVRAINNGDSNWRRGDGRAYENVNTAFIYDRDARLEFRQAAGSCDAGKIIAWVKYLQEMIQEVADRARTANFAVSSTHMATAAIRPVAPIGAPRMHPNSDASRALQQLCNNGVVTTAWAAQNGIVGPVLRRIIVGFRRHGAGLRTVSATGGPEYHLASVSFPCTPQAIFAPAPTVAPAPAPVQAVAGGNVASNPIPTTNAAAFVQYDFFAGLSVETANWVRSRRDTFAADNAAPTA